MARDPISPIHLVALLALLTVTASAISALAPTGLDGTVPASALQTEDSGAIRALVTDDVGRPISDAAVTIVGLDITNRTNATGYVLFEHLPTDANWTQYQVSASKTGYNPSGLVPVTVSPWNVTDVALEIFGGIIYGVVEDAIGPVPGATVSVTTLGYSNVTSSEGIYSIQGVPGNTNPYAVTASATGYVNKTQEIVVEAGTFRILNFMMTSLTGGISGSVLHASTEDPLYNASVSVRVGTVTVTVATSPDGSYRIPDLPSGTYTVTASMDGFEPSSESGVVVTSGYDTEGVDFSLVEKPTKLYGVVRSETQLLPGVVITIVGTELYTNTSVDGYYEITNITAGTYDLVASLEGYNSVTVSGVVIPRGGQKEVNINMVSLPGSSVSGLVLSSNGGQALSGVEVTVLGLAVQRGTITNVYGQFEVAGLTSGNYTIRFVMEGYKPKELGPVVVPAEGKVILSQVTLEPVSEGFGGFIFGFDLAHSMMILALFLTIIILALAVMLRIKTFESPEKAPAVYDDQDEMQEEEAAAKETGKQTDKQKRKDKKRK